MMGLDQIKSENRRAERESRKNKVLPLRAEVDGDTGVFKCPRIGERIPRGFVKTELYFVDNSGFGSVGESALTAEQFLTKVKAGRYYAIAESGQFQVYIQEFKKRGG